MTQPCGRKKNRNESIFTSVPHLEGLALRRATSLIQLTIQKIGSNPSLNDITTILDTRSGLRGAYEDMEDEVDEFINFDVVFIESPRFYIELIALARTTGDSVDEALSMSTDYLNNISDVDDIFQDSMMTCLELSSQITNLVGKTRDLTNNEVKDLLDMEKRSARTLKRMESH